jgi:alpha-methylacyl-CoA racemase
MQPLSHLRVLDLTRLLPGAVATMLLGDFGADVIKVEEPGTGDPARAYGGTPDDAGPLFRGTNRNKRSLTLDLKRAEAREVLQRLAARADVLVEGFRPGVMERLGVGWPTLHARHPRLVYCAITGYGQDGPAAGHAGHDINYLAQSGLLGLNAARDGAPVIPGVQIADLAGGALPAVIGILLALQARERNGEGQFVDIGMLDGTLGLMLLPLLRLLHEHTESLPGRETLSGRYACYRVYRTQDGRHVALGALEPKFWANACQVLGHPDLAAGQFAEGHEQARLQSEVEAIFLSRTAAEWVAAFEGRDACFSLVRSVPEVLEDAQVGHRGLIADGTLMPYVRLLATPAQIRCPAPRLGEHTAEILADIGYGGADIGRLAALRVT